MNETTNIRLRPVAAGDEVFLRKVYASARADEMAASGWDGAQTDAFISMQFTIRVRAYAMQYPLAASSVILAGDELAGQMIVDRGEHEIMLVDIAVLPEFRGRGIATQLIRELQSEAAASNKTVTLTVDRNNANAKRLYDHLGFVVVGENQLDQAMEWKTTN